MKKSGFTLIELLVVLVVIGIIAAIAIPRYQKSINRSKATEAVLLLNAVDKAQEMCMLQLGRYCTATELQQQDLGANANISWPN